jgi:hypothetical protein
MVPVKDGSTLALRIWKSLVSVTLTVGSVPEGIGITPYCSKSCPFPGSTVEHIGDHDGSAEFGDSKYYQQQYGQNQSKFNYGLSIFILKKQFPHFHG